MMTSEIIDDNDHEASYVQYSMYVCDLLLCVVYVVVVMVGGGVCV